MRGTLTIAARELSSFFRLPVGWVTIALYAFLGGLVFALSILEPGSPSTLRPLFAVSGWILLPVVPAISMRLLSEEIRAGTIEPLLTSPVGDGAIVLGKFLGAAGFLLLALLPTLVLAATLWLVSEPRPDVGPMVSGYLSLILAGMLFLSVGLLASSLTSNQTLAFLATFFVLLLILLIPTLGAGLLPAWLTPVVSRLAIGPRLGDFAQGVIDTRHVVFFIAASGWVLTLAYVSLASRRWR